MTSDVPEWDLSVDEQGRLTFAHPAQAHAYLRGQLKGQHIVGQFYAHRAKRSQRQNKGFHAMVWPWAKAEGHRIEDLKDDLLGVVFGYLEVTSLVTGEVKQVLAEPHTSTLSVGQFCELIDRTLEIAAEHGVILFAPDEYRRAKAARDKQAARAAATEAA